MDNTFDVSKYLSNLGKDLVHEFEKAGGATQSVAVGDAREKPARDKLRSVLPAGVGVGSGFVIDSYGHTSRQCDIILYEEAFALKFAINDDIQNAYYNCENVIAVGEVKSDASLEDVRDSINKFKVIRELKRYIPNMHYRYRPYLSPMSVIRTANMPVSKDDFNSEKNESDQIFTFLLCQSIKTTSESILKEMKQICGSNKSLYPNRIISIVGDYYCYATVLNKDIEMTYLSAMNANTLVAGKFENVFSVFIYDLMLFIKDGHSVPEEKYVYLCQTDSLQMNDMKAFSL
jgi:hypothetical protein